LRKERRVPAGGWKAARASSKKPDIEAVKAICAEIRALGTADTMSPNDRMARLNELHQQLSRALGLSAEETAEIERETEMRVAQKDEALSGSLPEDVAAAFRAIVGTEIERETEMRVAQKDEALSGSLPEDVAAAFRAIVGRDKTKH
jgi:tellurite resistance protein